MTNQLIVVLGKPGAGKSFVADTLATHFEFFLHNGDGDLPKEMEIILKKNGPITDTMRRQFLDNMIASVRQLSKTHERLVVHQAFIKRFMQKEFLDKFPDTLFLLVTADDSIREKRYMARDYFNLGLTYLRHMSSLFEEPEIPHATIMNNEDGSRKIIEQLKKIIRGNPFPLR